MSFIYRDRKDDDFSYGENPSFGYKRESVIYLKALDGGEVSEEKLLEWLRFSLDVTHFIKAWYKNGNGYFVKLHDSDEFVKLERSLV